MTIFLFLVAILAISVLLNKILWKTEITLLEMLINFGGIVLLLGIFWAVNVNTQLHDTQILSGKVESKKIEKVSCRHSYSCHCHTSCSGSGKSRTCSEYCQTCYDHLYDNDYVINTTINRFLINTIDRQGLKEPPRYTEVKVNDPVAKTDTYSNYVKASNTSLFKDKISLTDAEKKAFPKYPDKIYDYYKIDRVIDLTKKVAPEALKQANERLSLALNDLGKQKQVNIVIILTEETENYAMKLLAFWNGAKKNDVVVILGLKENAISYARIHAWDKDNLFDVKLRDSLLELSNLDLDRVIDTIAKEVSESFVRRPFKEFAYLKWQIVPSDLSLCIFIVLALAISTGVGYLLSRNEFFNSK